MKFNKQKVIKFLPLVMFGYFANKISQTLVREIINIHAINGYFARIDRIKFLL